MYQDRQSDIQELYSLANLGSDVVAYMREVSAEELAAAFPDAPSLDGEASCWALFAADGSPLMLAATPKDLEHSAFYHDLVAVRPN